MKGEPVDWMLEGRVASSRTPRFLAWTTRCHPRRWTDTVLVERGGASLKALTVSPCFQVIERCGNKIEAVFLPERVISLSVTFLL